MNVWVCASQKNGKREPNTEVPCLFFFQSEANGIYVATRLPLRERPRHGHHNPRPLSSSVTSSSMPGGPPRPSTLAKET
jgi:hypothetical protein